MEQIVEEVREWPPEKVAELAGRLTAPRTAPVGTERLNRMAELAERLHGSCPNFTTWEHQRRKLV
jgi:hypothetical protein